MNCRWCGTSIRLVEVPEGMVWRGEVYGRYFYCPPSPQDLAVRTHEPAVDWDAELKALTGGV